MKLSDMIKWARSGIKEYEKFIDTITRPLCDECKFRINRGQNAIRDCSECKKKKK